MSEQAQNPHVGCANSTNHKPEESVLSECDLALVECLSRISVNDHVKKISGEIEKKVGESLDRAIVIFNGQLEQKIQSLSKQLQLAQNDLFDVRRWMLRAIAKLIHHYAANRMTKEAANDIEETLDKAEQILSRHCKI